MSDELSEQRILEQSMRLPPRGAVTGWAGCRLWGAHLLDGLEPDGVTRTPVPLAVGTRGGVRRDPAVSVSFERLPSWEVALRHAIRTAVAERCVFDAVRAAGPREGLVALEAALAGRITSLVRMRAYVASHRSARRSGQAAWCLARASEHSLSPNETRLRLVAEDDAGHPPLLVNATLWSLSGERLGMVDLFDEAAGEAIEFDGADHRTSTRHAADVAKEDRLRRVGIEVARVTGRDLRLGAHLTERLVATRARALHLPACDRRWRVTPNPFDVERWLREEENWTWRQEQLAVRGW